MIYASLTFGDVKPYTITTVCMLKQCLLQNKPWLLYAWNLLWSLPCLTAFSAAYHISTTLHTTTYIWWLRVAGKIMFNNSLKTCIELSSINCTRHCTIQCTVYGEHCDKKTTTPSSQFTPIMPCLQTASFSHSSHSIKHIYRTSTEHDQTTWLLNTHSDMIRLSTSHRAMCSNSLFKATAPKLC